MQSFYITLICKLAIAFLGHYSEGEKITPSKLFWTTFTAGARDFLFFTLGAILFYICRYLMEWTAETIERQR